MAFILNGALPMSSKNFLSKALNAVSALVLSGVLLGFAFLNPAQAMENEEDEHRGSAIPVTTKEQCMGIFSDPEKEKQPQTINKLSGASLKSLGEKSIEVVTNPDKRNAYSVAISLCINPSERSKFAEKIQKIYDTHRLKLKYVDEGKFWQIPHVTLVLFEKVKLEDVGQFHVFFEQFNSVSLQFKPTTCRFLRRGDWPVVNTDAQTAIGFATLNSQMIDWAEKKLTPKTYKISKNSAKDKFLPHISLNTTVEASELNSKDRIKRTIGAALRSTVIDLGNVVITATNEWS